MKRRKKGRHFEKTLKISMASKTVIETDTIYVRVIQSFTSPIRCKMQRILKQDIPHSLHTEYINKKGIIGILNSKLPNVQKKNLSLF